MRDIADTHLRSRAVISSTHITRPREQMLTSVEPEPLLPPFPVVASRHLRLGRTDGRTATDGVCALENFSKECPAATHHPGEEHFLLRPSCDPS